MNIKVNSISGVDTQDSQLFKTLDYALEFVTKLTDKMINIYLDEGEYTLITHDNLFKSDKTVNIRGKNGKTIISQKQGFYSNSGGGSINFTLNIYNLMYNIPSVSSNHNYFYFNWNFYNVVFYNIANGSYSIFLPAKSTLTINNCVKNTDSSFFLRTDMGKILVSNSYGAFTTGYNSNQNSWDNGNNIITSTPKLDEKYKITDNTVSNKLYGVYSGLFTWRVAKFLLKQNNQYYSIKSDNYDATTKNFKPLVLNGVSTPNKLDFQTYGIDSLNILIENMTINEETFKPISKFSKVQIVSGTEEIEETSIRTQIIATPQGKLITPKNPRLLPANIKKLNKLTVTSNITGSSSIVKYVVSFDGVQYKTWNGTVWENIDLTIDNVKNKGMAISTINNVITWETIRGNSTKIWLAKYIEMDTSANNCEIDKEEINFDENGYWRSLNSTEVATHPITYGKNENNLFDSATVTNNSGNSENLMITSLSFVTTTDTKFKTFSVTGSNDLVSSVENGTLTFNSKNKTIKMVSDDITDTIDFDVDINTLPTF